MISVDLRNFVKPALQQIEFEMKEQENSLREANLQIQEKLDAVIEQIVDKTDELKLLQQRLNQRNEEYEHGKEVWETAFLQKNEWYSINMVGYLLVIERKTRKHKI